MGFWTAAFGRAGAFGAGSAGFAAGLRVGDGAVAATRLVRRRLDVVPDRVEAVAIYVNCMRLDG